MLYIDCSQHKTNYISNRIFAKNDESVLCVGKDEYIIEHLKQC